MLQWLLTAIHADAPRCTNPKHSQATKHAMSNTSKVTGVEITNEAAIRAAVQQLNKDGKRITLVENGVPRMYYDNQFVNAQRAQGRATTAEFVLRLEDSTYDVGLVREGRSFVPVLDNHAGIVAAVLSNGTPMKVGGDRNKHAIGAFLVEYGVQNAISVARRQGQSLTRVLNPKTGRPQLRIAVPV